MKLDDHIVALRELGDEALDGSSTRLRVRRTLEHGHGMRRHAGVLAALAVLLVASASWGFATGRIQKWFATSPSPSPKPSTRIATQEPTPAPIAEPTPAPIVEPTPAPIVEPAPAPAPVVVAPKPPTPTLTPTPTPTSKRYAKAHELYFHDQDYAGALAAFDEYLVHEPTGQFVAEARYNRALCLVHLDQLADAKLALQPFADGTVLAGYRQAEAKTLIEKIDHRLNGTR
jgi:TolA-binding protein